jgi:hypothetical protein
MALRPTISYRHIVSFNEALLAQALLKRLKKLRKSTRRTAGKKANDRQGRLLCARDERPRCRRAAKKRNEFAPLHLPPENRT